LGRRERARPNGYSAYAPNMDLLVVRHAIAEDREAFAKSGKDDAERPLTQTGRKKFQQGARGLRRLLSSIDLVATSPHVRARQTADILVKAFRLREAVHLSALLPEADPAALLSFLHRQRRKSLIAVVGHEPHLSKLVAFLLAGRRESFTDIKKGGACLIALGEEAKPGRAELRWLSTAAQLRRLGG